ncbi:copper chaperone PCu(A)C [Amphiplicatus metriothermophilus]|uniref:Copper(I)-binding protein n=1 Tax=Amphiplicatus metriothermophilus TaxID=1519374 RepID=A0A239PPJ0_9PROT|nr:copper chaperone PCu(A)C [Amphiplicatus metriothermophilus]MBB5518797.1 hypothetical protein [Amphiplicatus metriothermophilus]SNT72048.1 hypothetical protein SAMN06297382_1074 [Amphiplicatus metriothermophilus]
MDRRLAIALAAFALAACGKNGEESRAAAGPAGCGQDAEGVVVADAWARAADAAQPGTAAYFTLCNAGEETVYLAGVESDAAATAEMHETTRSPEGVVQMNRAERVALPPGEPVAFAPGGAHVMLMELARPLEEGGSTRLTLSFEGHPPVTVDAAVKAKTGPSKSHQNH